MFHSAVFIFIRQCILRRGFFIVETAHVPPCIISYKSELWQVLQIFFSLKIFFWLLNFCELRAAFIFFLAIHHCAEKISRKNLPTFIFWRNIFLVELQNHTSFYECFSVPFSPNQNVQMSYEKREIRTDFYIRCQRLRCKRNFILFFFFFFAGILAKVEIEIRV